MSETLTIGDLLCRCPSVLLGKHVAIPTRDGGPLVLSEDEVRAGWHEAGGVAYSPRLSSLVDVPSAEYEELYVFTHPTVLGKVEQFVNYYGFSLRDPAPGQCDWEQFLREVQERFWNTMESSGAESYVAEGDVFLFVTANAQAYSVVSALARDA